MDALVILGIVTLVLALFVRDVFLVTGIMSFLLAYFLVVGAGIAGDIADPVMWMIIGFFLLLGVLCIAAGRRRRRRKNRF